MISKLAIRNFKSLRDVQVDLERFTVFVGPNASGKSSILQAAHFLCRSFFPVRQEPSMHGYQRKVREFNVNNELAKGSSRGANGPVEVIARSSDGWCWFRTTSESEAMSPPSSGQAVKRLGDGPAIAQSEIPDRWAAWTSIDPPPLPRSVLLRL